MATVADAGAVAGGRREGTGARAGGASPGAPRFGTAFRFALREMRGGLKGFYVFIACIALGVGAIAGVGSLAGALGNGISAEGQAILGGDAAFTLIHREATAEERGALAEEGTVSEVATLRAMARDPDTLDQTLVEVKAVDDAYPLYGSLDLASGDALHDTIGPRTDGAWPVVVDPSLLATQDLSIGDTFALGEITARVADTIEREPDKLSSGVGFGPRVMLTTEALRASGLVQPGSLVEWSYRVRGDDGTMDQAAIRRMVERVETAFPRAGWEIRTRQDAAPGLRNSIDRFAQFLTLVGLTALLVGGVGVANAVRSYLARKRATIASLRSLGARGAFVFRVYLFQITLLALVGIAIGLAFGAAIPPVAGFFLAGLLPVEQLFALFPGELALAALYGLLTALTFALWPLGSAHDVKPTALFRDGEGAAGRRLPRRGYLAATALAGAVLVALAVGLAYDPRIAGIYVAATLAAFVLLRAVGAGVMALARRAPRFPSAVVRLAVDNIHRRGALTPTVVLSLGLSLTLLVTLALIDGNLRNTLMSQLPDRAPSFFFVDIQNAERDRFVTFLEEKAPDARVEVQPMLRGRIAAIDGVPAAEYEAAPEAEWVLRGDRGITYSAEPPENAVVTAGEWWEGDGGAVPQVSFADELARELGLSVGDTITVNVLGREIDTRLANFRTVEWESLSINFVMVFSPNAFRGAPHANLATLTWPDGADADKEIALLKEISATFPTITAVRVKEALEAVNSVVSDLVLAIRAAAGVTLVASILVLAGTLAASHRSRIYDAVILKTLGATRGRIVAAFALEYTLLGLATALFGLLAGSLAAWFVLESLMDVDFALLPGAVLGAVAGALVVTVGLGLVGTWRALGEKPAPVLRNL